jgi:signal transduction histidine kinase
MIGDLLEATRAESRKLRVDPRCVALDAVVDQAVSMLRATAKEKGIGLEMAVDSRIPLACPRRPGPDSASAHQSD